MRRPPRASAQAPGRSVADRRLQFVTRRARSILDSPGPSRTGGECRRACYDRTDSKGGCGGAAQEIVNPDTRCDASKSRKNTNQEKENERLPDLYPSLGLSDRRDRAYRRRSADLRAIPHPDYYTRGMVAAISYA